MTRTHSTATAITAPSHSGDTAMSAAAAASAKTTNTTNTAGHLRRLYFVRFVFAAAWAGAFAAIGSKIDAGSVTLLILYPAFDVAAAIFDARSTRDRALYVNIAISTVAAIGLAAAAAGDIAAVLRTWGAWAIVAGLVQLFVALQRRRALGGQWAMILSGGISVIAGSGFLGQASSATSMKLLAGYAALGGLFFLISAVRLLRQGNQSKLAGAR
jgi:uncharacterized membrane protein HdeD (DUF308 family)